MTALLALVRLACVGRQERRSAVGYNDKPLCRGTTDASFTRLPFVKQCSWFNAAHYALADLARYLLECW
jgi:hypothetical protein